MCFVTERDLILVIIIFLTLLSETIQESKNHYSFCGFLCSVYFILSRAVYKERTKSQPQSGSGALVATRRRGSCLEQGSIEWVFIKVSTTPMMSDYEKDLHDLLTENKERLAEFMVGSYRAQSTDQCTAGSGIRTKIPPLFDGSPSRFTYEEFIDDWLDLTVLEAEKRGPALKNRLVGDAEIYKGLLVREPLKAADGVILQERVETSLHQRISECVPLEILSVHPSKKSKHRDCQVDRQVFIALEFMDGHVTVVRHERRAKKKVSCRRGSGEC